MIFRSKFIPRLIGPVKTTILLSVVFFFMGFETDVAGQKRFSRSFPAGQSVRLNLMNRSGTVEVEGWNRPEIRIIATLEAPAANIQPQSGDGVIDINLVRDNKGRGEVGSVNFSVRVPYNSFVDIETRIGNLSVSNVRSGLVRAHISSDGDITLTNVIASRVSAENGLGNIFFDGEILEGGQYRFSSMNGQINLRIPLPSSFRLVATAPSTRSISLGPFANPDTSYVSDGRRVMGRFGPGSAEVWVTNKRGSIAFFAR
jgi:hypothetical protein